MREGGRREKPQKLRLKDNRKGRKKRGKFKESFWLC